ncbi:Thioredoxin-like protein yneN [Bacteroidales bacterium CF]|jgi:Thiol-disulfide isomerase and thioredoxins|nr:Thioredoxin-like protein yneN [Bacteroidales bacterium CF]
MRYKIIFMGILFAALSVSCSPKYSVSGKITGLKNDTMYVALKSDSPERPNLNKSGFYDTVILKNGKFGFNLDDSFFKEVCLYPLGTNIHILKSGIRIGYYSDFITLFHSGENIKVNADFDGRIISYTLKGSPLNEAYSEFLSSTWDAKRMRWESLKEIGELRKAKKPLTEGQAKLKETIKSLHDIQLDYVSKNMNSPLSPYILSKLYFTPDDYPKILTYRGKFSDEVMVSPLAYSFINIISSAEKYSVENYEAAKREQEKKDSTLNSLIGKPAPDFSLRSYQGETISLSSLKGKYILVDFWGSWCGWCIEAIPEIQKYYEKYKEKMNFLTVACSDKESSWKSAIEKHKMQGFVNLIDENGKVASLYSLHAYPTMLIINPKGIIEAVGNGEITERIDKLF